MVTIIFRKHDETKIKAISVLPELIQNRQSHVAIGLPPLRQAQDRDFTKNYLGCGLCAVPAAGDISASWLISFCS
jgi:hypothetical protein